MIRRALYRFVHDARSAERWWGCTLLGLIFIGVIIVAAVMVSVR